MLAGDHSRIRSALFKTIVELTGSTRPNQPRQTDNDHARRRPDMIIALSSVIHPGRIAEIDATIRTDADI
jgi:hypothetical protein